MKTMAIEPMYDQSYSRKNKIYSLQDSQDQEGLKKGCPKNEYSKNNCASYFWTFNI